MKDNILIVTANFYQEISVNLKKGAVDVFEANNHKIKTIDVPGVFEIPGVIAKYIDSYVGIVALGCIIKGKTPHFDLISKTVTNAIMDLSIKHKKPIGNGIISCLNKKQALERSNSNKGINKGKEAAIAVSNVIASCQLHETE